MSNRCGFGKRSSVFETAPSRKFGRNRFLMVVAAVIFGAALIALFSKPGPVAAIQPKQASGCGPGGAGLVQNAKLGVKYTTRVRNSPLAGGEDIVNEKLTAVVGRTQFQELDSSETLQESCRLGGWSLITVVEPPWLTHVTGWAPTDALRTFQTVDNRRAFVESDISWDSDLSRYDRRKIVAAFNRVALVRNECPTFDSGSLSLAIGRGRPDNPVFFVTCSMPDLRSYNVFFDIDGNIL